MCKNVLGRAWRSTMLLFSNAFCLVLATVLASCSLAGASGGDDPGKYGGPIVGGTPAIHYPEAVLVDLLQNGQVVAACSGTLIAPNVVLTAGHCVHGFDGWQVIAPYASGQTAQSSKGQTHDWTDDSGVVNPSMHDLGLVFLSSPITIASYPLLATAPLVDGSQVINIGRIDNGQFSTTDLYQSKPISVTNAASEGFPYDYIANDVIEPGDSGGPDMAVGTHTIVAVNSGAGGGTEVLARVDLLVPWIQLAIELNTLAFIKTANTPNGHVEVHLASETSGYMTRILETATTFANESDGFWQLLPNEDLVFIKTSNTPSGHVEVHIASSASNYQSRILETATTFANESDGFWQLLPNEDLAFIKTSNTPNGHVEVHIASRASNYQVRTVETPTTFMNESDGVWSVLGG